MAEYYLISQLPSLDGIADSAELPITEERLYELCDRFLGTKAKKEIEGLTLIPPKHGEKSQSALVEAWNEGERNLRFALAKVRSEKMKKTLGDAVFQVPSEYLKTASVAVEIDSPLEAERFLNKYRLEYLETLRPVDSFSLDYVYYYALRLKLMQHIRGFNKEAGITRYKKIYDSVLNGDGEVTE
ncbi:MAG: hypothetical protein E7615_08345 [Ruminococcaceae bacterium]|nr:hypothetical protein [Oscillospiraceae bacterium]